MKKFLLMMMSVLLLLTTGCSLFIDQGHLQNAGMLVETTVDNNPWNQKGYEGMQAIETKYDADLFYKENIKTKEDVQKAVDDLVNEGVNLIFGNSSVYGQYFDNLTESYPGVNFVYFNGDQFNERVTSLNFNAHAMGFFAGMLAGEMTMTNHVGVIGVFDWQSEIEGFYEGVTYQKPEAEVHLNYVNDWQGKDKAMQMYDTLRDEQADVIYPVGDSFSTEVIKAAKSDDIYAIGYTEDQSELAEQHVLTSTVKDVEELYLKAAKNVNDGELRGGVLTYDFQDDVISLGKFSPDVPDDVKKTIEKEVKKYKKTGLLPPERDSK